MLSAVIAHTGRTDCQCAVARAADQAAVQVLDADGYWHWFGGFGALFLFNLLNAVIEFGNRIKRAAAELFGFLVLFKRSSIITSFTRNVTKRGDGRTILIISRWLDAPEIRSCLIELTDHHVRARKSEQDVRGYTVVSNRKFKIGNRGGVFTVLIFFQPLHTTRIRVVLFSDV